MTDRENLIINLIRGIDNTLVCTLIAAVCFVLGTRDAQAGECSVYSESTAFHSSRIPVVEYPGGTPAPGSTDYGATAISGIHLTGVGRANVCASAQTHISKDHPLSLYWYIDVHVAGGPGEGALINHGGLASGATPILYCANLSWEGGDAYAVLHVWARTPSTFTGPRPEYLIVSPQGKRMTALMFVDC